ncbi:MAG TPA: cyclic nucleotide-binding domain-containing protein [Gallionellaceae bacterium]
MAEMNFATLFQHETDLLEIGAGHPLFKEGDDMNETMYVLMAGTADILVNGKVVEAAKPGAILGEMAMVDQGMRSATVVAKSDCKLVVIGRRRFDFLVQQTPNFALGVMRVIANRLRRKDSTL